MTWRLRFTSAALTTIWLLPSAKALDFAWLGSSDPQWSNKNNWNPVGIPSNGDNASIFGYSPSGIVSINVNYDSSVPAASLGTLTISGNSDGSLTTSSATLNLTSGTLSAAREIVGVTPPGTTSAEYGRGIIDQSGGANNVGTLIIGDQNSYVAGAYNLSGTGVLNVTSVEQIGYPLVNNGAFTQSGGTHTAATLKIGGAYNLSAGSLSTIQTIVGGGTLTQTGGNTSATVFSIGGTLIGPFGVVIDTPGNVFASGGVLNATTLAVGADAAGTLSIAGSALVATHQLDNYGTVLLSGGTLSLTTLNNHGTFSWTGGALELQSATTFDDSADATTAGGFLNGGVSLTSNRTLEVNGTETLGGAGTFTLTIPAGGANIVHQLNIASKGKLNLTGGSLTCTAINEVGLPLFNWSAGTLTLLSAVTLDPNASTLTTGSIFGSTLALNNRSLIAPAETITSTVRSASMAVAVGANGNNLVSGTLTVGSLGSLTIGGGTVQAGSTIVASGGKLLYSSGTFSPGSFSVTGTGAATFSAPGATVVANSLSVDSNAKLDLGSSKVIVHSADANRLRTAIHTAYDGGAWDGNGLRSTSVTAGSKLAIGYLLNDVGNGTTFYSTFGGVPVNSTDTLMKYTYIGDANLDGTVNAADFVLLSNNFGRTSAGWWQGDFNYDGTTDAADFVLLSNNFGQGPGPAAMTPAELAQYDALAARLGLQTNAIPEPAIIPALLGIAAMTRRRCTKRA